MKSPAKRCMCRPRIPWERQPQQNHLTITKEGEQSMFVVVHQSICEAIPD